MSLDSTDSPSPVGKFKNAGSKDAVTLLVLAGVIAVLFTAAAGLYLFLVTARLTNAAKLVEHTQEVLSALQRASLLTERAQYRSRSYALTGDDEQLNVARISANQIATSASRLRTLVADNHGQDQNVEDLSACAADLSQKLNSFTRQSQPLDIVLQRCQKTISLMNSQEQLLLTERTAYTQNSFFRSLATELIFVGISILAFITLFGFLIRDAIRRQRGARHTAHINDRLARTVTELNEKARESELMNSARNELQLCVNIQEVYDTATRSFSRLLPGTTGALCILENSRLHVEVVSAWGEVPLENSSLADSCCALRSGQPRWRQPESSEIHCKHFATTPPDRYMCRPIVAHGNAIGFLYIQCTADEEIERVNRLMDSIRQLVQIAALAIATINLQAKLENQSIRDALTGLYNRHFMQMSMEREMARAIRRRQIMAVLMLDVDHFKKFNDTNGHGAGDIALAAVAGVINNSIRAEDIACRYGGEEFTVILPDTTVEGAIDRAEAILQGVSALIVPSGKEVFSGFTVSIGMAFYPGDGNSAELLLQRADAALYRAKNQGRNQVTLFETAFSER